MTSLAGAVAQMSAAGMPPLPDGHPRIGRIERYGPKKSAYYRLYEQRSRRGEAVLTGWFGWWGRIDTTNIVAEWGGIDPAEQARMRREAAEQQAREERRRAERAHNAANRARLQWQAGTEAGPWPYLDRKQLTPEAVKAFADGTMLVPMTHVEGKALVAVQKIAPDGTKRFNKHAAIAGACAVLGEVFVDPPPNLVILAEGYATARSIRMALGGSAPVVVAFNAGNLVPVATGLRKRLPLAHVLIAADDDFQTEGNPGMTWAQRAAEAAGAERGMASVVRPLFESRGDAKWTDFNDLHVFQALDAVRDQVVAAIGAGLTLQRDRQSASVERMLAGAGGGSSAGGTPPPRDPPAGAGEDPPPPDNAPENGAHEWRDQLKKNDKGFLPSLSNVELIFRNDKAWLGLIAKNDFSDAVCKLRAPPFDGLGEVGDWTDQDDLQAAIWLDRAYGIRPRKDVVTDAVLAAAQRNRFHPVRDYLEQLPEWDQVERCEHWAIDYLGVADSEYSRKASAKWLTAAVARVMQPGCKADNVLILEGHQGIYKSTALKVLGGEWFGDPRFALGDKEAYVLMQGLWIVELAELDAFSKAESSAAKHFFTQDVNHYRPWYGKRPVKVPRQCVFAGSVNHTEYFKDDSGNRRYWPLWCSEINLDGLRSVRDQLWAEALVRYRNVRQAETPEVRDQWAWWVTNAERELFEGEQERRYVQDAFVDLIRGWLEGTDIKARMASEAFDGFTLAEILSEAVKLDRGRWSPAEQQRIGRCMRQLNFVRQRSSAAGRPWVYRPGLLERGSTSSEPRKDPVGDEDEAVPF